MLMTNEEILRDWRQAADKKKQIGILADLNSCTKWDIAEILTGAGEKIDGRWVGKKPSRPAGEVSETEPAPETEDTEPFEPEADIGSDEALALIVRSAAVETIAYLLNASEREGDEGGVFREQVRGVLALVHELEDPAQKEMAV